jgi:hypothetical protein
MKTQEEIEKLAIDIIKTRFNETAGYHKVVYVEAYIRAYLQCQEDMAKELEMHILVNEHDWSRNPQAQLKDFINSLNKQDV